MLTFLLRRLISIPPLLVVISFLTYLLLQAAPGDFFSDKEADPKTSRDTLMGMRASAGKRTPERTCATETSDASMNA